MTASKMVFHTLAQIDLDLFDTRLTDLLEAIDYAHEFIDNKPSANIFLDAYLVLFFVAGEAYARNKAMEMCTTTKKD